METAKKMLSCQAFRDADGVLDKIGETELALGVIFEQKISLQASTLRKFAGIFADFAEELRDIAAKEEQEPLPEGSPVQSTGRRKPVYKE